MCGGRFGEFDETVGGGHHANQAGGSKETGSKETGRKETGRKETGRKETGRKETGRKETGSKPVGVKEIPVKAGNVRWERPTTRSFWNALADPNVTRWRPPG